MELIVCDSKSRDGTPQLITKYHNRFRNLRIISKKCTRGEGRQIAFENSTGRYIIAIDLDVIYNDAWREFIVWHRRHQPDFAVQTRGCGIYPREAIEQIGGWKKLNHSEDLDIWIKLAVKGKMRFSDLVTGYNLAYLHTPQGLPNKIEQFTRTLIWLRDLLSLKRTTFRQVLFGSGFLWIKIPAIFLGKVLSFSVRGIVSTQEHCRSDIIDKNIIELPIHGLFGQWYWRGFTASVKPSKYKECLVCGRPILVHNKYCIQCLSELKKQRLISDQTF